MHCQSAVATLLLSLIVTTAGAAATGGVAVTGAAAGATGAAAGAAGAAVGAVMGKWPPPTSITNPSGVWTTTGTSSAARLEFEDGVVWLLVAGTDAGFDAAASGVWPSAIRMAEVMVIQVTAIAVPSAMRIRTAPPFVGRTWRQALLGGGRAPAIAYAPRSESGKASSDLAYRRRVCGRLCEARGLSSVCPLFVVGRLARATGAPEPRLVRGASHRYHLLHTAELHAAA